MDERRYRYCKKSFQPSKFQSREALCAEYHRQKFRLEAIKSTPGSGR